MHVGSNWKSTWELEAGTDLVWNTECMLAQSGSILRNYKLEQTWFGIQNAGWLKLEVDLGTRS